MNCAKHDAFLLVFAFGLAHTMATTTSKFLKCWQQQQLQISWILYTPTPWQLNARLLGASWDQLGLVGTSWE